MHISIGVSRSHFASSRCANNGEKKEPVPLFHRPEFMWFTYRRYKGWLMLHYKKSELAFAMEWEEMKQRTPWCKKRFTTSNDLEMYLRI